MWPNPQETVEILKKSLLKFTEDILKGYLHYKTITSQSVLSEAQVKKFFISQKSYVLFSRYSSFCGFGHPAIYQICGVMNSISTWDRVHFWIYHLNHNSLTHQTWSIDRCKQGQYLEPFERFGGMELSSRPFSI